MREIRPRIADLYMTLEAMWSNVLPIEDKWKLQCFDFTRHGVRYIREFDDARGLF